MKKENAKQKVNERKREKTISEYKIMFLVTLPILSKLSKLTKAYSSIK